jgi:hypothetical protein
MPKATPKSLNRSTPNPTKLTHAKAFAMLESEIAAVPDNALINITTDIPQAVQTAMGAAKRIEILMPDLSRLPPDLFDLPRARKLRLYAGATLYAHLQAAESAVPESELRTMLAEASTLRGRLLTVGEALGTLGLMSAKRVAVIRRGNGHRSTASNLTALASLYEAAWPRIGNQVPITFEQVQRASVLGTNLLQALGDRQLEAEPIEPVDDARRTRVRAYTLFMRAYTTCRYGVSFLRCWQGDADKFVPSLHPRRRRRTPAAETEDLLDPSSATESDAA